MARAATKTNTKPAAKRKPAKAAPKAAARTKAAAKNGPTAWSLKGELALNCSCEVFCPCVISLGAHPPTYGYCQAWLGIRIDEGKSGRTKLGGLNVAMLLDIPYSMGQGDWKVATYIDERATKAQFTALETILQGRAKGTTGLFRLLVSEWLETKMAPVTYEVKDGVRTVSAGRAILGQIEPIEGAEPGKPVLIQNTGYWMGPEVIASRSLKSKVRDFGRVWNFDNKSAEICSIDWSGP